MILPTSHIPDAEIIMHGSVDSFNAFESSTLCVNCNPGNSSGLSPLSMNSWTSGLNKSKFCLNICVAETASGLSTYTGVFIKISYSFLNSSSSKCCSLTWFNS